MSITGMFHALTIAIRFGDAPTICNVLDQLGNDVLAANYTESMEYNTDIYEAAAKVYEIALELVFGTDAEDFRHYAELGAADHAFFIAGWFANEAWKAIEAAELVAAVNSDHADGWHSRPGNPNQSVDFPYWVSQGCRECAAIALDNAAREVAEIVALLDGNGHRILSREDYLNDNH